MKRRAKTTRKGRVPRSYSHLLQDSSDEEEPLVVPKVIKQYVRKKEAQSLEPESNLNSTSNIIVAATWSIEKQKVIPTEPISKCEGISNITVAATWSEQTNSNFFDNNDVKIKQEIMKRFPDIEVLPVVEIENYVKSEDSISTSGVSIEGNHVFIKEEHLDDNSVLSAGNGLDRNGAYGHLNNHDIFKESEALETKSAVIEINVHNTCSNQKADTITIKEENMIDKDYLNSNLYKMHETETIIKIEQIKHESPIEGTHCEEGIDVDINPIGEINKSETDLSNNEKNILADGCGKVPPINKLQQVLHVDDKIPAPLNKILITEEIHIKEEFTNTETNCVKVKDKATVSNKKKEPVLQTLKLRRVINMPRILKTYGRKQPDPAPLKKCFLIAVNPQTPVKIKKSLVCDLCGKVFIGKATISKHMRLVHRVANNHTCGVCGAAFAHHYLLLAHTRAHATDLLACDLCPKRFKSKGKYGDHLNTHLRERLFSCPICLRRYPLLIHLQRHVEKHTPEDTFACTTCTESYRSMIDLLRHSESDHGEKVEIPCYVCSRILNTDHLSHVKTHDNVMHPCAFCPKKFIDAQRWEAHSTEHIEKRAAGERTFIKPFTCDYCKKTFKYQSILTTHIRMHTGERPYECPECFKKLKTQGALSEHVNSHKRPFSCMHCDKRFGKRNSLSRHMLLHSGERPHACPSCPMTFVQRSGMLHHCRRQHEPGLMRLPKTRNAKKSNNN